MPELPMSEVDWKSRVIDAAKLFGWRYAHFRPARTKYGWVTPMEGDKGFPDLVLVRPPRLILAELKVHPPTQKAGRPTEEQAEWLRQLALVDGCEAYVWRPPDWQSVYLTLAQDSYASRHQSQPAAALGDPAHADTAPAGLR
ncbi:MAG TPA: hypothetical protein VGU71_22375 [Candidatus Dormibacteraeota bacterium]|nr:hypothetical protein [Candidatus Dormibacteraeota bacterium]